MAPVRKAVCAAVFIIVSCVIAAVLIFFSLYTQASAVYVDGELWGYVTDAEDVDEAAAGVAERVGRIRNESYTLPHDIEYENVVILKDKLTSADEIGQKLYDSVRDITEAFVLKVDGETVGIGDSEEGLSDIVETVRDSYVNENTTSVEVVSDVEITYETVAADITSDPDEIAGVLYSVEREPVVYTARDGETIEEIAGETGVSASSLFSMNPGLYGSLSEDGSAVRGDTDLVIEPEERKLVVETCESVSYEVEIGYDSVLEEDDNMVVGEVETRSEGQTGAYQQVESVVYQNGVETNRWDTGQIETSEPAAEVIAIGTKEPEQQEDTWEVDLLPEGDSYYASGYWWPLEYYGSVSSGVGTRYLNGSWEYHKGIDIPAPAGTPIYASNAGQVLYNQYDNSRGWFVQLDHGDGYKTIYQHMIWQSDLTVGDFVEQGQLIGFVGSTGYSFGNHLHFEVWLNNYIEDPFENLFGDIISSDTINMRNSLAACAESFLDCPYVAGGRGFDVAQASDLADYVSGTYEIDIPDSLTTPGGVRSYAQAYGGISVPYVFDDAGLVGYVYRHLGYEDMPMTTGELLEQGVSVSGDALVPGDLIFFSADDGDEAVDVGMYVGDGQYIHASAEKGNVCLEPLENGDDGLILDCRRIVTS